MRISSIFYSIKQGFKNIFRNKMFSLVSIATMAACIFMFGLFYILFTNFSNMVREAEQGVAVTVFFDDALNNCFSQNIASLKYPLLRVNGPTLSKGFSYNSFADVFKY